jgi:predicted GNAT superfamily acetyltransferase
MSHTESDEIVAIGEADVTGDSPLGDKLLALNNDNALALSWLEPEGLRQLVAEAFFAGRVGEVDALLIAFDQGADYDSPNFLWFEARYQRFVYVDRVVVAAQARGRGLARRFYLALFRLAAQAGHDKIVCEINSDPPNPESDRFHEALGFTQIGSGLINEGRKAVRYMVRELGSDPTYTETR